MPPLKIISANRKQDDIYAMVKLEIHLSYTFTWVVTKELYIKSCLHIPTIHIHLNNLFLIFVTETISRNNNCLKHFFLKWIFANYLFSISKSGFVSLMSIWQPKFLFWIIFFVSLELTRVNSDRNIFSMNVELTSTFFTLRRFGPSPSPNLKYKLCNSSLNHRISNPLYFYCKQSL